MLIMFVNLLKFVSRKVTITVICYIDLVAFMIYNCTINLDRRLSLWHEKLE